MGFLFPHLVHRYNRLESLLFKNIMGSRPRRGSRVAIPQNSNPSRRSNRSGWQGTLSAPIRRRCPFRHCWVSKPAVCKSVGPVPWTPITDSCSHWCRLHTRNRGWTRILMSYSCRWRASDSIGRTNFPTRRLGAMRKQIKSFWSGKSEVIHKYSLNERARFAI